MRQSPTAFTFIAAAALSVSLASCSNKKDLTEGNLIDALNTYYAPGPGICLHAEQFPIAASRAEIRNAETVGNDPVLTPIPGLEALKSAGLLASHDAPSPASDGAVARTYVLTDAGAAAFKDMPAASGPVPNDSRYGAFCYGHVQVTHVAKWDAEYMGESTAYFNYEMAGLPEWAKRQDVQRAFPALGRLVRGADPGKTSSVVMRLTSNGWEVKH